MKFNAKIKTKTMKHFYKSLGLLSLLVLIVITNVSTNKSNWAGINLASSEKNRSVNFQLARGGTCLGEFNHLKPTLNRFINLRYDASHLGQILGEPNEVKVLPMQTKYLYHLSANNKKDNLEIVIKNRMLVSYSVN